MTVTAEQISQSVCEQIACELREATDRIEHCVSQLDEGQLWWRPDESMNSVANLVLHLCGNVRQWIIIGLGGGQDLRDRPAEFAARGGADKQDLLKQLQETVAAARAVLAGVTPQQLVQPHRIQGFDVSGTQALIECVSHFRGHTQEIVHLARRQLGEAYVFAFVPATPEQGAPAELDPGEA